MMRRVSEAGSHHFPLGDIQQVLHPSKVQVHLKYIRLQKLLEETNWTVLYCSDERL